MENILDLLFTETDSGLPEINKAGLLLESFRTIFKRDPGRGTPKVKEIARKEVAYIFFICKKEHFEGYPADERDKIIRERLALPEKWNPDAVVLKAIAEMSIDVVTSQDRLLAAARKNLDNYMTLFEEADTHTTSLIKLLQAEATTIENNTEREEALKNAKAYFKETTTNIKELKNAYDILDQLTEAQKTVKKKEGRKQISKTETNHDLYKRED